MDVQNGAEAFCVRIATIDDLDRLTLLHCDSFGPEEHIPVLLGRDYVQATYRWLTTSHQAYCLAAESDHKIIGFVAVCDGPYTRPMFLACLPELTLSLLQAPTLIFHKRLWERLLRHPKSSEEAKRLIDHQGFAQLSIIAVDARSRGMGVFPALIEAAKAYSKTRGSMAIRAGVYKFNQASRKAFAKSGWIEVPELETNDTVFYVCYLDPELPQRWGVESHIVPKK